MNNGEIYWIKLAFAAAVALVGLAGALLPWIIGGRRANARILALSDTFAGGVLGGAGLIHLLGGGIAEFQATLPGVGYPLALLLAGMGFMLILLIEGVIVPARPGITETIRTQGSPAVQHETGWNFEASRAVPYPVILLIVLSVHSVILGLALGAQQALSGAIIVFLAIVAHKSAAGFALGIGYERAGIRHRRALPQIGFFAAMTPLGIVIGASVGLALTAHSAHLFEAIFDSLGAGTFIYIAALDIIKTEFDNPKYRLQKWLAAVFGFGLMALLAIWL